MSLQTMTAPAVGHRPLEPGIGVDQPLDDLVETVQRTPRGNSNGDVVSNAQNQDRAAADKDAEVVQETATPNDAVKEEAADTTRDAAADDEARKRQEQEERERQSAASSLLAQILGSESSKTETYGQPPATPVVERMTDVSTDYKPPQEDRSLNNTDPNQPVGDQAQEPKEGVIKVENREPATYADNQQGIPAPSTSGGMAENAIATKMPDMVSGAMEDPLSKTSNEPNSLFTPFDAGTTNAPNVMDDMLSNPFMAQNVGISDVDLSGLPAVSGYPSTDPYDTNTATSVSGSEPRIQAFAKLEFDDGHFYVNTYSFILGRDVRAARAAYQRELQARQNMSKSSRRHKNSGGDSTSHTPKRKREGSAVIGSVVSDCGGIMGYDPDIPPRRRSQLSHRESNGSLPESALHASPAQLQTPGYTDYNALAMQSLGEGDAKPVDTLALLPSPDACPTIPIHPPAAADGSAAGHKGISRKHVKIAYNFDKNLFEMAVIGRNGAFIGGDWLAPGEVRPLHSGDYIQIGGVRIRFLLPDVPIGETGADRVEEVSPDEGGAALSAPVSADPGEADQMNSSDAAKATKPPDRPPTIEGNTEIVPPKRRGPGRPPKDGIMSKRERAELAREQKLAAKREANGGVTPPPLKMKVSKPRKEDSAEDPSKQDKKKSAKRKLPDGSDVPLPSIEGGDPAQQQAAGTKPPPPKKRKPSRSPSPDYPPESAYTEEQLAKPPYNYAVLIFDALSESKTPMTLKQIYRALKLKYPYFRFKCETEGWTSSVRHNLNGNRNLFEHAERDGKGWSWQLVAGATVDKEKKRRPSPPPVQNISQTQNNSSVRDQQQQQRQQQPQRQHYMPPPGHQFHHQGIPMGPHNQQYQYHSMLPNRYNASAPAPQHASSYPPQPSFKPHPQAPHSAPPQDVKIPAAFSRPAPSGYSSPYKSNLPPELSNHQRQQQQQQLQPPMPGPKRAEAAPAQNVQHPQPYGPPASHPTYPPPPNGNVHRAPMPPPPGGIPPQPPPQPQLQPQPQPQVHPPQPHQPQPQPHQHPQPSPYPSAMQASSVQPEQQVPAPEDNGESEPAMSFEERANKAIDDFEAVLMEDYDDKEYIREVLKSARARALGHAQESSFPGGEPKDEAVILDALKNLIGSLKGESNGGV